jgi:LPXTG-motif cell wall-anchored protein
VPIRLTIALLALLLALPSAALAQGAGDQQYSDPFGGSQASPTPTATPAPAQPAPVQSQATPVPAAAPPASATPAPASGRRQLPYTGADARLLALAGIVLLAAGIALRRRAANA